MPIRAKAGHGATIAMELAPSGSPGVFTTFAELNGDITWPTLSRPETETTPHEKNIDEYVLGVLKRGPLTFSVNYVFDEDTHDSTTGAYKGILINEIRGFRMRGPGGSANTDEWIASGQVQSIDQKSPVREGVRSADITIRFSGPMIIDGVSYGA